MGALHFWFKICFVKWASFAGAKAKVDKPNETRKEIKCVFLYKAVSKIEKYSIPHSMVMNFNQTPFKLA